MADQFYLSVGEAIGGMGTLISQIGGLITTGTFQILWLNPVDTFGPGFRLSYINSATRLLVVTNFIVLSTATVPVPIQWITMVGSATRQFGTNTGTFPTSITTIMDQLSDAMITLFESFCGATILGAYANDITMPGMSKPWLASRIIWAQQAYDARMWQVVLTDFGPSSNMPAPQLNPSLIANPGGSVYLANVPCGVSQAQSPMDIDVAINNGANIFSVNSRTFTEPGPDDGV